MKRQEDDLVQFAKLEALLAFLYSMKVSKMV